ncbi:MAG TPA: hypothetical protein VJT49_14835 [Amycolatopsis sp.]|uniref:hypothetical protein n=1 Tax=Amycolatopsis sp. TaxID=37632 RepID=UPI002B4AA93B|nr:hypothetical protein [Amycolatopsis sp.]HKS46354.1 hypothetical protein [Amycolatopsis sp.]
MKLKADVAEYMAGMRAAGAATKDLEKAARDVRKAHADEEDAAGRVRVAEAKLAELRKNDKITVVQTAKAEEDLAKAKRELSLATDRTAQATARFEKAQKDAADQADKTGEKFRGLSRDVRFNAAQFGAAYAGLPVLAAAAGAGVAAGLAVVPVALAGVATAVLSSNAQVQDSFFGLTKNVRTSVAGMVQPLQHDVVSAIDQADAAFDRMKPQIAAAFAGSGQYIEPLTEGVLNAAENALPALNVAVRSAGPPIQGLKSLASDAGAGVTDFFVDLSAGAKSSQGILVTAGGAVRDFEGFVGRLLANVSNNGGPALTQFAGGLHQVEDVAVSLTGHTSPLYGAVSGFLTTASGGIGVLQGLAGALGALPPEVSQFGGELFAVNRIAGLFGTSLSQTGFGLAAFSTYTDASGKSTTKFRTALDDAGTNGTSKFKAGVSSVIESGLNPLGLAMIAGGLILDDYGRQQQDAAQAAAEHRENVRSLTDAIRQDNGALGEHARQVNVEALNAKNAAANAAVFGSTIQDATAATMGNGDALNRITVSSDNYIASTLRSAGATDGQVQGMLDLNHQLLSTGGNANAAADKIGDLTRVSEDGITAATSLGDAQIRGINATLNFSGAVGEQIKAAREAHDAYLVMESGVTGLSTAQVELRDKTNEATQAMYAQQNAQLGYRGTVLTSQDALDKYNKTLSDSKSKDEDKQKALLSLEQAWAAQEQAAYNAAYANSKAATDGGKVTEALAAMNQETAQIAKSWKGELPQSLQATIAKMSEADARAAGLVVTVDQFGQSIVRLPSGKTVVLDTDTTKAANKLKVWTQQADGTYAFTTTDSRIDPATGKVQTWTRQTNGTWAWTNTDSRIDAATGTVQIWQRRTNGTWAWTSTDTRIDPATGAVQRWVQQTNGTWAWVNTGANVRPAQGAIDNLIRDNNGKVITIHVRTDTGYRNIGIGTGAYGSMNALGGIVTPMADGGILGFAAGGRALTPMSAIAQRVPPNTLRFVGDRLVDDEYYIPANGSARSLSILAQANADPKLGGAVRRSLQAGTAVVQSMPSVAVSSAVPSLGDLSLEAHVYVGDREITDIVDTRITVKSRAVRRAVTSGSGAAR